MNKIYERQFTAVDGSEITLDAGQQIVYVSEIVIDGEDAVDGIRWPHEGKITKVVVRRSGGNSGAATEFYVDLFNQPISAATYATLGPLSRIIPMQTTPIASTLSLISDEGYPFKNMERGQTDPSRRIYMRIAMDAVAGAGGVTWDVALTCIVAVPV